MPSLRGPMIAVLAAPLLTFVTYSSAVKSAAGESLEVTGRRRAVKQLIISVGETLGPTGSLVVGGVATILAVIWLIYTILAQQKMTATVEDVPSDSDA